jgi:hypothetical protein
LYRPEKVSTDAYFSKEIHHLSSYRVSILNAAITDRSSMLCMILESSWMIYTCKPTAANAGQWMHYIWINIWILRMGQQTYLHMRWVLLSLCLRVWNCVHAIAHSYIMYGECRKKKWKNLSQQSVQMSKDLVIAIA